MLLASDLKKNKNTITEKLEKRIKAANSMGSTSIRSRIFSKAMVNHVMNYFKNNGFGVYAEALPYTHGYFITIMWRD